MAYFDVTTLDDLDYLPADLRRATNLALVARESEADVIAAYTRASAASLPDVYPSVEVDTRRHVFLSGYEIDPDDLDSDVDPDLGFLRAMKRTIADVVVWRLIQEQRESASTGQSDFQGKSRSWAAGHDSRFPRDWDHALRPYDTRVPPWGM